MGRLALLLLWLSTCAAQAQWLNPAEGNISRVLVALPPDDWISTPAGPQLRAGSAALITGLRAALAAELVLAVPAAHAAGVPAHWGRVVPVTVPDYTRWVRDLMLVDADGRWHLTPGLVRRQDAQLGPVLADALGIDAEPLPWLLEGGNWLPFGPWQLAGPDTVPAGEERAAVIALRPEARWLWLPPLPAGDWPGAGRAQPLYHLDLFLTLAGDPDQPTALVADTALAARLLDYADPYPALSAQLDQWADWLAQQGLAVARLPLVAGHWVDDEVATGATQPVWIGYHNVLLDAVARRVYLPRYGAERADLAPLDAWVAARYRALGYQVHWVTGPYLALGRDFGGLRCWVQVLERR